MMSNGVDYGSAARSLAINETSMPSSPVLEHGRPAWNRRQSTASILSPSHPRSTRERIALRVEHYIHWGSTIWKQTPWWQRVLAVLFLLTLNVLIILFWVYNEPIMVWLHPKAVAWREKFGGWILIWLMIFTCAFPPVIGYSTMLTVSGFIYGVWKGWLIAASANVIGSFCAFIVCRRFFRNWAERKLASNTKFQALGLVLQHDGIGLLTMIRLCPLPYSASNGAFSTFPTLKPQAFAVATALATPKLLIHVFIGSRFDVIGEGGGEMDSTTKMINYLGMAFSGFLSAGTSYLIYRKTQARARELEIAEQAKLEDEAALTHPDVFAEEDAHDLDDEAIRRSIGALDDNDYIDLPDDMEPYRDDAHD